jgi:peptide/nickel transport system substrate-binding protein
MKRYLCACIGLVLVLAIAGCGGSKDQTGKVASNGGSGSSKPYPELRWGLTTFPGVLDWPRNPQGSLIVVESLAVNNLVEFEPDGKVKPGLASSIEQPNPTTYVYHLKSVKFSDGKPMTSADVVYSLDRNINSKEAWDKAYWADVASINPQGGSTVVIKLKQPSAVFPAVLGFTSEVIEKAAAEKIGEKALGTPGHMLIGTGPWKLDSYTPEASVELSRNPYWTGTPQPAQKITVDLFKTEASLALALRSGAIDGTFFDETPKTFANIPGNRPLVAPGTTVEYVSANTQLAPFNDVHVRHALAYASDSKGMIGALYPGGDAAEDQTIMPTSLFSNLGTQSEIDATLGSLPKYEFNLVKARQELARSAYPHGFTTEIQLDEESNNLTSAAEIFASDLAKIGITAKVHPLSASQWTALWLGGKTKLSMQELLAAYPDPEGIMSTLISPAQISSGLNSAKYANPEVDKLLAESAGTLNTGKRLQMIGKLLKTVGSDAPYWPLYTHATFGALSEKYVLPTFSAWTALFRPWALDVRLAS